MMKRQTKLFSGWKIVVLSLSVLAIAQLAPSWAVAQGTQVMVGVTPLTSKVADIPAEAAQDLFINALMETNHFSIRPPDASGSHAGSTYVLEPTISEAKSKSEGNVLGMLKEAVASKSSLNLTIRVFDPRTKALLKSVTVKSSDTNSGKVGLGDVPSLMGALGVGKGDKAEEGEQSDETAQLEERLGDLMQQAATRLATQLGGGATGMQRSGAAQRR